MLKPSRLAQIALLLPPGATVGPIFDYPGTKILAIHDGDTVTIQSAVTVDYGFGCTSIFTHPARDLRLLGINAPELATAEGRLALAYIDTLIRPGDLVDMQTVKLHSRWGDIDKAEKFGRILATIYVPSNPVSVNQQMIDAGHAVPYMV